MCNETRNDFHFLNLFTEKNKFQIVGMQLHDTHHNCGQSLAMALFITWMQEESPYLKMEECEH